MRGPSARRTTFGKRKSATRSSSAKPPSGPTSTASGGRRGAGRAGGGEGGDRVLDLGVFVAEHQQAVRIALRQQAVERYRVADFRQRQDATLLGRLDRIGPHAVEIDPADLAVACQHRLQPRGPELDGLLHHVIEAGVFERCEQVMQIERAELGPGQRLHGQGNAAFSAVSERCPPFAVPSIEDQDPVAGLAAKHIAQIVGLGGVQSEAGASVQRGRNVTALGCGNRSAAWRVPENA